MTIVTIYIPAMRLVQTHELERPIRLAADNASKAWYAGMSAAFVAFMTSLFVLRDNGFTRPTWTVLGLGLAFIIAAYATRAIMERNALRPLIAEASQYFKRYPDEYNPAALNEWHRLLDEANAGDYPKGITAWLNGPYAQHLVVLSATADHSSRGFMEAAYSRALHQLHLAAKDFAADNRRVARRQRKLTRAEKIRAYHFTQS